jgi:hypothetical protein
MTADRTPTLHVPVPSRENASAKALRLVLEGRLRVRLVHRGRVRVDVRGDSGRLYAVTYTHGSWHCSCRAGHGDCSHKRATWLVIAAGDEA